MTHYITTELTKLLGHIPPSFWWWLWVVAYSAGSILTLWVLSLIKNLAGWAGVVAVLLLLTYVYGFERGFLHVSVWPWQNPIPHFEVLR